MDKIIVFGVGTFFANHKKTLTELGNIKIIAFIDNNSHLWGKQMDGIPICSPECGIQMNYDFILIMAAKVIEIKNQLLNMGVEAGKVFFYEQYMAAREKGKAEIFLSDNYSGKGKKVLIIVPELGYSGVPIMALNTALAVKNMGYQVFLAAFFGDDEYMTNARKMGISIMLMKSLMIPDQSTLEMLCEFSCIIVNSIGMENLVSELSKHKRICWWLHNAKQVYREVFDKYGKINESDLENVLVYAVSRVAADNFCACFPKTNVNILNGGIPDKASGEENRKRKDNNLIFAIIGYTSWIKAQDIFVEAIQKIPEHLKKKAHFWIIGKWGKGKYEEILEGKLKDCAGIEKKGELKGQKMLEAYENIDVVVNCSRDETLSLVAIEGMMHKKVCIVSEAAGIADFVRDKENALICKKEDSEDLCRQISWVIEHENELQEIRKNARETYERNFSMKAFENQLSYVLKQI